MNSKKFFMLGYSESQETIIKNRINTFHNEININFDFKLENNPIEYAAILDIDFYNSHKITNRAVHIGNGWARGSKSFGSIVYSNNKIIFNYIDFGHNSAQIYPLVNADDKWHHVSVSIKRENMKCIEKYCEFSDCFHPEALIINDEEINWDPENKKVHKKITIKIDDSPAIEFNYLASSEYVEVSFGNNTVNKDYPDETINEIYKKHYKKEKTFCLKDISLLIDKSEIDLNEHFISPLIENLNYNTEKCFYCPKKSKYFDTIEHEKKYIVAELCEDHFVQPEVSS